MFNSWSKTQKSMRRRVAGDSATSRTANLATRRCTKPASPATCLPKIATSSSHVTRLRPELKHPPILGGTNFLDAARMAAVVAAKERQMAQMVADVLQSALSAPNDTMIFVESIMDPYDAP